MKTLSRLLALTTVSLFSALVPASHAAPASAVGDWDFVMSGKQRGIAVMTFDPGFTLFGSQILRPAPPANPSSNGDARNPGGTSDSRTPTGPSTNGTPTTSTNFYGSTDVEGMWVQESSGRLIGSFRELYYTLESVTRSYTNVVDMTNQITTITMLENVRHTNGISFRGKIGSGGKMTLTVYTPRGQSIFTGVRMATLPDYSGNYYGVATKDRPVVEFFSTSPNGLGSGGYSVTDGFGPGYAFDGRMLVSKQKQVAILAYTEYGELSIYTGPYKTNRVTGANAISGDLRGTDGVKRNFPYKLSPRP